MYIYPVNFKNIKANVNNVEFNYNDNKLLDSVILKYKTFKIQLKAVGDCCSESYIDCNIKLFNKLRNKCISKITYRRDYDIVNDDDEIKTCIYKIETTDDCSIEFKLINVSNGYYEGWLEIQSNQSFK